MSHQSRTLRDHRATSAIQATEEAEACALEHFLAELDGIRPMTASGPLQDPVQEYIDDLDRYLSEAADWADENDKGGR